MAQYRDRLPQLDGGLFLTDGGIETTLIFHDGFELPYFAAFYLLKEDAGRAGLADYFRRHAEVARQAGTGFILESATWRASPDWAEKLGYSPEELQRANRAAIGMLHELRAEFETGDAPVVVSGCVGPRGDGYDAGRIMDPEEAQAYHAPQIATFAEADADMVTAITMTNVNEAIGVTRAARAAGMPVAIFLHSGDGRHPSVGRDARSGDRSGGGGNRSWPGLLHDQLRPSGPFCGDPQRFLGRADQGHPGECLAHEPCRAGRGGGARCGGSG